MRECHQTFPKRTTTRWSSQAGSPPIGCAGRSRCSIWCKRLTPRASFPRRRHRRSSFDAVVDAALAALPDKSRHDVELVDVDGLTYSEAASALGIPEGTVTNRLHRARKRIRDRLSAADLAPRRRMT